MLQIQVTSGSLDKAAVEAQKRAHEALLLEERWRKEHYNRRDT